MNYIITADNSTECWRLIHECRLPMREAARKLNCGVHDIGVMLTRETARRRAIELELAKHAGPVPRDLAAEAAEREEQRTRRMMRARKLIADGVEFQAIGEMLEVDPRTIFEMPEARERTARRRLEAAKEQQADREREKAEIAAIGRRRPWTAVPSIVRAAVEKRTAALDQVRRDSWSVAERQRYRRD